MPRPTRKSKRAVQEPQPQNEPADSQDDATEGADWMMVGLDAQRGVLEQAIVKTAQYEVRQPSQEGIDLSVDASRLSNPELARYHSYAQNMHSFMITEVAKADVYSNLIKSQIKDLKSRLMIALDGGQTKYKLEAEIAERPDMKKLVEKDNIAEAYKVMLTAKTKAMENSSWLYQREISRRSSERAQGQS